MDRASGEEPLDEGVDLEAPEAERRRVIADVLGPRLRALLPREEAKPAEKDSAPPPPPKEKEEEEAPAGERVRHAAGSSIFGVEVGFEVGGRSFSYSDPISKGLRGYGVLGAPMVAVAAEVYPFATTSVPFLKDLGLQGGYARAFALQSAVQGGAPLATRYQRIDGGLRGRIRFSGAEGPVLGISGGVRLLEFHVDEPPTLAGQVPNTAYLILRGGLDTRIPVGRAGILLGAFWFQPLRSGEVYGRFTGASVLGVDATLGLSVRIAGGFEARLWAEYTRFFSDFDPVLGDAYVAGGALDQYLGLRLAAAYVE